MNYINFVKTLVKKFPFGSTILCDLRILNPSERRTYKDFPAAVVHLAISASLSSVCLRLKTGRIED